MSRRVLRFRVVNWRPESPALVDRAAMTWRQPVSTSRRSTLRRRFAICFVLGVAVAVTPARGDGNLLDNPELDAGDASWLGGEWSVDDSGSCPGSGSLGMSSVQCGPPFGCTDVGFWRAFALPCVDVAPGMTLYQSADVRSNQITFLYLQFFSDPGCGSPGADNADPSLYVPAGDWQTIWRTSVIPAGVLSIVPVFTSGGFASTNVTGNVDRAWLGLEERIFADDFEIESTCRWSSSSGG